MLGMGGADRPVSQHNLLQSAPRVHPRGFRLNTAGGDPEARPMAGPEGFAPIPRWAPWFAALN